MNENMKQALLRMYRNLDEASARQASRGVYDQGARSQVTGGRHLDAVAEVVRDDLIAQGYVPERVYYKNGCLRLPGWFRPSKDWDLLAFDGEDLLGAVEFKSINSSFSNNANNRAEESIGSAVDIAHAIKNDLIPYQTTPPLVGYALVVRVCESSTKSGGAPQRSVYPIDPEFNGASYLKRLSVLCRRLLSEGLYQAVWIVGVDPEKGLIMEPEPDLTYEKFIASIASRLMIHRA